ncbi:voltage-dependent anion channel-domain-containing protein [Xylariaceae sp. FL0594]|nr:voltage-dependent anion channel-domain-containing protein [Xylariaceae sp. FL0594]
MSDQLSPKSSRDNGSSSSVPEPDRPQLRFDDGDKKNMTMDDIGGIAIRRKSSLSRAKTHLLGRLKHFTWANFTLPMATGGLALLLAEEAQGYTFPGLQTIGKVVYVLDLVIFALVVAAISYRFVRYPGSVRASVAHPTESLYLGTSTLSVASIISGISRYGVPACGPWLITADRILFWIYFVVTFLIAVAQYAYLFTSPRLKLADMTPGWLLPVFPFMLSGTIASVEVERQPQSASIPIIVAGLGAQGFGLLVSIFIYACYVLRMILYGFPAPNSRPGMFIAVGPPAFTSLAIIGMAERFPVTYDVWGDGETTRQVLRILALTVSVFIWFLSLWFFCIAAVANLAVRNELTFHLNWYSYIFPNVGFTITVIAVGKVLQSPAVKGTGSAMTILLVVAWLAVVAQHVRALWRGQILKEGKDEDYYVDERRHSYVKGIVRDEEKQT